MPSVSIERATIMARNYLEERGLNIHDIDPSLFNDFVKEIGDYGNSVPIGIVAMSTGIAPTVESIRRHSGGIGTNLTREYTPREVVSRPQRVTFSSISDFMEAPEPIPVPVQRSEPSRRRSETSMVMDIVRSETFPRPHFRDWSSDRELQNIIDDWYRNVEYKDQWIFSRREREGFNRRNIGQFSLDDVMARMTKRKNGHNLDNDISKFYDWKLGGTEWILRLELLKIEETYFLISRYIHKPSNIEIKYDVRFWRDDKFKHLVGVWSEYHNNDSVFDRAIGNYRNDNDFMIFNDDDDCEEEHDDEEGDYYSYGESDWSDED